MKINQKGEFLVVFLLITFIEPFSYSIHITEGKTSNLMVQKMRGESSTQSSHDFQTISQNLPPNLSTKYDQRGPIHIDNNDEFSGIYDFPGSGSRSDPYILENYHINPTPEHWGDIIAISNTNRHFHIRNCIISGGSNGILLENVRNVHVYNTYIVNNSYSGIILAWSGDIVLNNNTLTTNSS
ncbi:MAG: right-handed parallel beta-helix repeat-containing protein [Promethearchaeota archaeon]